MQAVGIVRVKSVLSSACLTSQLPCCAQLEFLRWRKPRWIPQAKSKMFKVPNRIRPPPNQATERKYLLDHYKLGIKSLAMNQKKINYGGLEAQLSDAQGALDDAELDKIIEENDRINQQVRERREKILAEEWIEMEKAIAEKKFEYEMEDEQFVAEQEKELQYHLERIKKAVKLEDLDELIEKALASEVDFNYAIDKYGNRYPGRFNNNKKETTNPDSPPSTTPPPSEASESSQQLQAQ